MNLEQRDGGGADDGGGVRLEGQAGVVGVRLEGQEFDWRCRSEDGGTGVSGNAEVTLEGQ